MGFFDRVFGRPEAQAALPAADLALNLPTTTTMPAAQVGESAVFTDLHDAAVAEFLRGGHASQSGVEVTVTEALKNPTVFRCIDLLCSSIATLALNVHREDERGYLHKATDHPVHRLLRHRPNAWQTPFEFKALMQFRVLTEENGAIAMIARSGAKPVALIPLDPQRVEVKQRSDFSVDYIYTRENGGRIVLRQDEVLHLRGLSRDGLKGVSRIKLAAEAIGIAVSAERAVANMFRNGTFATGALKIPKELSPEAFDRLAGQWRERYAGTGNAGMVPILEDGADYVPLAINARDAQSSEARKFQVEEILRTFGVPRSLAMVDDTTWGSGVEQLSKGFVDFTLKPWFQIWEEAIDLSLLDGDGALCAKFDATPMSRGTSKDQADTNAKALGGNTGWKTINEVRAEDNLPPRADGDRLTTASAPSQPQEAEAAAEQALADREDLNDQA